MTSKGKSSATNKSQPLLDKELDPENDPAVQKYKERFLGDRNPFARAGIISRLFYGWMMPIMKVRTIHPSKTTPKTIKNPELPKKANFDVFSFQTKQFCNKSISTASDTSIRV